MEINDTRPAPGSLEQASSDFSSSSTTMQQAGMDRDAFLTIFLAQIENQDPLSPQDASELGAQLATFSQLEQSIHMAEELAGVNERLDRLIDATGQKQQSVLDPVSLIGHDVEVGLDRISLPRAGESARLRMQVEDGDGEFLVLEARDALGQSIGAAVVGRADENGERVRLARGSYELFFQDGQAHVRFPGGEVAQVAFEPLVSDETGNLVIRDDADSGATLQPSAGTTYAFDARLIGRGSDGTSFSRPLVTTSTGTVDSVHMVDGFPVLSIADQEIDPSRIIRIR